jgi:hypothetical protein
MFENADLVHRYTRTDAIRDGILIDASAIACEAASGRDAPRHTPGTLFAYGCGTLLRPWRLMRGPRGQAPGERLVCRWPSASNIAKDPGSSLGAAW